MGPEGPARDTARCVGCGRCAQACLTGAIDVAGRRISCQELTELVLRDEKIFRTTAGGVTCSGGEPLLQADAVAELLGGMHARGLHTCVDTAGNVPWEAFEQVLPVTDLFLYDVKAYSPQTHRQWTGVGNERILENLRPHRPRTGRAAVHAGSAPDAALRAKDQLRLRILCLRVVAPGTAEIAALQKHGGPHAGSIMERHALDIRNEQLLHGAASVSSPRRSRVSY